jgi:hypothetical protein
VIRIKATSLYITSKIETRMRRQVSGSLAGCTNKRKDSMTRDALPSALIAALRGGPNSTAAELVAAFARCRRDEGVKVVGVIVPPGHGAPHHGGHHGHGEGHGGCGCGGTMLDLASGELIGIHQDLGPGSEACSLDTSALADVCGAVERAIAAGAELVVLGRFGGQEATRGGLLAAFQAAVAAGIPVACAVTPHAEAAWNEFAGDLAVWLPSDAEALDAWWRQRQNARRVAA